LEPVAQLVSAQFQTPAQRILGHPTTTQSTKQRIEQLLDKNDPLELWDEITGHLKAYLAMKKKLQPPREGGEVA
jgi:hypothetical protein